MAQRTTGEETLVGVGRYLSFRSKIQFAIYIVRSRLSSCEAEGAIIGKAD